MCDCTALPPGFARADLDQHDGLAGPRRLDRRRPELVAVANALDVAGDDADPRVVGEEIAEVAEFEIALVSGAEEVADADLLGVRERRDRGADRTALADEADRARGESRLVEDLADRRDDSSCRLASPTELGPMKRMPFSNALLTERPLQTRRLRPPSRRSPTTGSAPTSPAPAGTRSSNSAIRAAGTAITSRSTSPSISASERKQRNAADLVELRMNRIDRAGNSRASAERRAAANRAFPGRTTRRRSRWSRVAAAP